MSVSKKASISAAALLALSLLVCVFSGKEFLRMRRGEDIFPSDGLSARRLLSGYFPALRETPGDTDVFVYEGREQGGNILILGGTHPNEPSGFAAAVALVENLKLGRGKIIVIPRANASGFTHSDLQEGNPQEFAIGTPSGKRRFRLGARVSNPVHQWPDPAFYVNPSKQKLAGIESRNLNRCFPGRKNGYLTEKVAFGIMELIRKERIDLGIDLHESSPEYPVINAIVFHETGADLAALAQMELQADGFDFRLEASPLNLKGLSHREWGDSAGIMAVLIETPNVGQGRLKGKPSADLIVNGKDKNYAEAARQGRLFIEYGEAGIPLASRVARHLAAIQALLSSLGELEPDKAVGIDNIPPWADVRTSGLGRFLHPPKKPKFAWR
jgi:hypothetical protein